MDCEIVNPEEMMEGIRPKFVVQSSAGEHGAHGVTNSTMGSLNRTVLVRRVCSGHLDGITSIAEKLKNSSTIGKIAATIHANILVGNIARETLGSKEAIEELERRSLGDKSFATECTTMMISYEDVASLTMKAKEAIVARSIGRTLDNKTKVNRKTLPTLSSSARVTKGICLLVGFRMSANWTEIKVTSLWQGRNANNMSMEVRKTTRMQVSKTLMPENTLLRNRNTDGTDHGGCRKGSCGGGRRKKKRIAE
jgi:hypothetical protein